MRPQARWRLAKVVVVTALVVVWEVGTRLFHVSPLLFPPASSVLRALGQSVLQGEVPEYAAQSLRVLLAAMAIGAALTLLLTSAAVTTKTGSAVLETLTSMFNPLPAIALMPLSLLWFGLGTGSLIFVVVHSVLWPMALNTYTGFVTVPPTLRKVGQSFGLSGWAYVAGILRPAAFPHILAGVKIGWAFAWRTLIAAELVFGVSSGKGGLGWYIYENKNMLDIPAVFAGLFTVILIGLVVENLIFRNIEAATVRRWGMQS